MTLCPIHSVAFGGEGVGRVYGLAVFVPFTLPGEVAEVEITQKKRNFAKAKLQTLIETSPDRVDPPCPYFSKCGGCQLQHASYPLQLQLKKRFIEDSLTRIGNIHFDVPPVVPSMLPFAYRRHISLKIKNIKDSFKLGFSTVDGLHLPIYSCLLFEENPLQNATKEPILSFLQTVISQLSPLLPLSESIVKIIKHSQNHHLIACSFSTPLPTQEIELLKKLLPCNPSICGWIIKTPTQHFEWGEITPFFIHNDLIFNYSPFGFVQNHPEQSGYIYDWILNANVHSKKVLDLYCGIGTSSLLLAKEGKEVIGIELNSISVEMAVKNAEQNLIKNVQFFCSSAETSTHTTLHSFKPDGLVVNPPKAGISPEILKEISKSSVQTITYISCNPPTFARDLAYLVKEGFELQNLQGFDMFPQTTHVETAAQLVRKKKSPLI